MLPKNKRISKEAFQYIHKNGKTISSPLFLFRYLPENTPHFAFVVPKSVEKRAISRNKLKRQGYNSIRTLKLPNISGIFIYKKLKNKPEMKDIRSEVVGIMSKISL